MRARSNDDDDDDDDARATSFERKTAWIRESFVDVANAAVWRVARSPSTEHRSRCRFQVVRDDDGALAYATWIVAHNLTCVAARRDEPS